MDRNHGDIENILSDETLKNMISNHIVNYQKYLNPRKHCEKKEALKCFINDEKTKINFIDNIESELFQLKGKKVLDVGCGKGGVAISCALRGAKVFGFDTDEDEIKIAKLRTESYGLDNVSISKGDAENISFPDNSFDLVIATSVLEHVKILENVIKEMVRVAKFGGFCSTATPNPLYPREAHYKVFYIPYMPKFLGKIYLKLRGHNPDFFMKCVTYPYPSINKISKILKENGMEVIELHKKNILKKFDSPDLIMTNHIQTIVTILKKLRLNNFVGNLICKIFPYQGFFIVAKKKGIVLPYEKV